MSSYLNARNAKDAKRHIDDARGNGRTPPLTDKTAKIEIDCIYRVTFDLLLSFDLEGQKIDKKKRGGRRNVTVIK